MYIKLNDKIFVAGHRGMVGSAVLRSLKKHSYDNLIIASRNELDLLDREKVKKFLIKNKPDIVILAAAKVGGISANNLFPTEFLLENLKIQNNLIEESWRLGVKRFLFLGSSCIYPKYSEQPIREESLLTGSLEPTNEWYALAKITGIKLCSALRKQYDFDAISLMPTNLYGPGDNYNLSNSHVLPAFIRRFYEANINSEKEVTCWGSGNPLREFLHVDDLGEACIYALENWNPNSKDAPKMDNGSILDYLNVGTGIDITIKELAYYIAESVGFKGDIKWDLLKPDGTPKKQLDVSRLKNIGWQSKINLDQGIKNTVSSFIRSYESNDIRL